MLASTVERQRDAPAVIDGDVQLTWAELEQHARGFGAALVASGVETGDRVAIWAPNSWRWIVAVLGVFEAGASLVPVNTRFKGSEAADILQRGGARVLVTTTDFLGTDYVAMLRATHAALTSLETIVVTAGPTPDGSIGWDEFTSSTTREAVAEVACRRAALGPDDRSDILFTSGTTGVPKGVVMTHGRTLQVATDWVAMTGLSADDRYLMINPYFHMFGLKAGILACVASGATMYPEPTFDVDAALARVERDAITVLPGAPTIYQSILDHPNRRAHDLATLRVAVTGAADIPVALIERIRTELPFDMIVTGYGLTEAGTASATLATDDPETVATTVGPPRPGFNVRIVDGDRDVPTGNTGEVLLRGPSVMAEYLDDPAATAEALSGDGWLRTGDLGVLDERGYLRIVGRSKDMFIVGGFNAYPAEIENALLRHPEVQQAAVIGIPDERLGEVGMAFVVTSSGDPTAADEIRAWCRDEMANYKVPRVVEVIDALPLNATGKVVKDDLRARVAPRSLMHHGLERAAQQWPDRVAIRAGDASWSFTELDGLANAWAHHLGGRGVSRGDRVAVMMGNRVEFVAVVHGISKLGAAAVLVSPAWKAIEVGHAIDLTGAGIGVADGLGVTVLAQQLGTAAVIDLDATKVDATEPGPIDGPLLGADDESVLVFSSGTTGLPKAVRHTHGSIVIATGHWSAALGLGPDDRFQVATPPSHILGLLNLLAAASAGATVRLHARFDLDELLGRIASERMTLEMAVAPIALAMAQHPDLERYDLSSLRYIMWGATPVTASVAEEVTRRSGVGWLPAYGASELPVITANPVADPEAWRLDSAGLPPSGVELRVADLDTGAVLAPGDIGEIQARSGSVMAGYLPEDANADAFTADGWYRTGDVGWIEPAGWVHLTDRSKEMIKVKGFQVAPAEIEAVLHGHPGVVDCAVFGIEDATAGEVPVAAVQLDPAHPVTPEQLQALVAEALASYKRLHHVAIVDAIPRLPSGKVLRRTLRDEWSR
ncbi:MAG: FadD3 family acyl-CoA ligase [Acidimicrobiales bacterium]